MLPCLQGHLELVRRNPLEIQCIRRLYLRPRLVVSGTYSGSPVLVTRVFTKLAATATAERPVVPHGESHSLAQEKLVGE